jgi:hypothetical protein
VKDILFRAWDKDAGGQYYYFSLEDLNYGRVKMTLSTCIVERFTGLRDCTGKDIYEGDIVKTTTGNCVVVWQRQSAAFVFGMNGWMYNHFIEEMGEVEVIGNIHEHPHLLEKKK